MGSLRGWICVLCCALCACGARSALDDQRDAASEPDDATSPDAARMPNGCFTALDVGGSACALRNDGAIYCWSNTLFLHLGASIVVAPTRVPGIDPVLDLKVGSEYVCATTRAGLHCFGHNNFGQLGIHNGYLDQSTPTLLDGLPTELRAVSAGGTHACAIDASGQLFCWGNNGWDEVDRSRRDLLTVDAPIAVAGPLNDVAAVAAGEVHTCAITHDDALYCWGGRAASPLPITAPTYVSQLREGAKRITAGNEFSCLIGDDDVARCWGVNGYATLGDGTIEPHDTPTPILVDDNVRFADIDTGWSHACAASLDGEVYCWGMDWWSTLGAAPSCNDDGVCVPSIVPGIQGHAIKVSVATDYSCALTREGDVWCWGDQDFGQLGVVADDLGPSPTPVRIDLPCP